MNTREWEEAMIRVAAITEEEAEAIQEAARVLAEQLKAAYEEAREAILRVFPELGQFDFEALEEAAEEG